MYIDYTQFQQFLKNPEILGDAEEVNGEDRVSTIEKTNFAEEIINDEDDEEEEYELIVKKVPRSKKSAHRATPGLIPAAEFLESLNGSTSSQTNSRHHRHQLDYEGSDKSSVLSHHQQQNKKAKSNPPMGFDLIEKIRNFLHLGTNRVEDGSLETNRKRRLESVPNEKAYFKYRKVDNKFPKIIPKPFEEDVPSCSQINRENYNQNFNIDRQQASEHGRFTPTNMAQQRKTIGQEKDEKKSRRNSLFNQPQTIRKKVSNARYAEFEFSDDEDCEIIGTISCNDSKVNNRNLYQGTGRETFGEHSQNHSAARVANFCNIPITNVDQLIGKMGIRKSQQKRMSSSFKPPPPPLIEPRTGGVLAMTLLPDLQAIPQQNGYGNNDNMSSYQNYRSARDRDVSGTKNQRIFNMPTSSSKMNGGLTSKVKHFAKSCRNSARSIIEREQQTKEREKYSELLKMVVPRLYGQQEGSFKNFNAESFEQQQPRYRSPPPKLTATICLTDDDDDDEEEAVIDVDEAANLGIINEDDVSEVIDLAADEEHVVSACSKLNSFNCSVSEPSIKKQTSMKRRTLPYVEPVNSLKERLDLSPICKENWYEGFKARWETKTKENSRRAEEATKEVEKLTAERKKIEKETQQRFRELSIVDPELVVLDDFTESEASDAESEEAEPEVIEFTQQQMERIRFAMSGPRNEVLITKFNMSITRRDIETLMNLNWLNDEIINYYMNLLIERSEKRTELPKVHAMNTFFVPRLLEGGYSAVRRWTRKVNIFERDIIPVPVHVGGVHWCMAIIHLKNKTIKYYDSMGTPNPKVLAALEKYLQEESMDKLKQPFDTSQFEIDSVRDVPRQMNGSDCGVFSCMFAEYITRNREITFTQEHMPFFRQKMILEIVQGELLL